MCKYVRSNKERVTSKKQRVTSKKLFLYCFQITIWLWLPKWRKYNWCGHSNLSVTILAMWKIILSGIRGNAVFGNWNPFTQNGFRALFFFKKKSNSPVALHFSEKVTSIKKKVDATYWASDLQSNRCPPSTYSKLGYVKAKDFKDFCREML